MFLVGVCCLEDCNCNELLVFITVLNNYIPLVDDHCSGRRVNAVKLGRGDLWTFGFSSRRRCFEVFVTLEASLLTFRGG